MTKISNQYSLTNVLFADAVNGRVGIGTTSPLTNLMVGDGAVTQQPYISLARTATGGYWAGIRWYDGTTVKSYIQEDSDYMLRFGTANTLRMVINASGNVGIGTSSPSTKLHVKGALTIERSDAAQSSTISNEGGNFFITASSGYNTIFSDGSTERMRITSSGQLIVGATSMAYGNNIGYCAGFIGGSTSQSFISIARSGQTLGSQGMNVGVDTNAAYILNNDNTPLMFYTNASDRGRFTALGYFKASNYGGAWFPTGTQHEFNQNTTGSDVLILRNISATPYGMYIYFNASPNNTSQYFVEFTDGTNPKFSVYSNGSVYNRTGTYAAYSDIKLKENIVDATPKLDDLLKVKIRNYNLIGDDLKQIGVIAQELEEIFPNMIDDTVSKETGEITKGVKYSIFIPMLIKGLQEQQLQINELKALLNAQ